MTKMQSPVSYTHLDVYKRQGAEFTAKGKVVLSEGWKVVERKMLGELLGKQKEPAVLPDVQAVSYTHLSTSRAV